MRVVLPDISGVSAATLAVSTLMLAVGTAGPAVHFDHDAPRDSQRVTQSITVASKDVYAKIERTMSSAVRAESSLEALQAAASDPDTVVLKAKRARNDVRRFIEDVDLVVLAFGTFRERAIAFQRLHSVYLSTNPTLEGKIAEGVCALDAIEEDMRSHIEKFRESRAMEVLDQVVETAVDAVSKYALARAFIEAKALGRRPTVEEAMKTLDDIGDFLRAHNLKLGTG